MPRKCSLCDKPDHRDDPDYLLKDWVRVEISSNNSVLHKILCGSCKGALRMILPKLFTAPGREQLTGKR